MYEEHGEDFPESRRPLEPCGGLHPYLNEPLPSTGRKSE